jgi:hypothetical protein
MFLNENKMDLHEQLHAAIKVKRVIDSCKTLDQLNNARQFLNLFFQRFSQPGNLRSSFRTVKADQSTVKLYNNLFNIWEQKVAEIYSPE